MIQVFLNEMKLNEVEADLGLTGRSLETQLQTVQAQQRACQR